VAADPLVDPARRRDQDREGGAHEEGREDQEDQRDGEAAERRRPEVEAEEEGAVQVAHPHQGGGDGQRVETDRELHPAVGADAVPDATGERAAGDAAEPEAQHVGDEDRARRERRRPEHEAELTRPDHLEDEAPEPGHEETGGERREEEWRMGIGVDRLPELGGHPRHASTMAFPQRECF
jgi:hypothetical protein